MAGPVLIRDPAAAVAFVLARDAALEPMGLGPSEAREKRRRMAASPLAFLRATPGLFVADLAALAGPFGAPARLRPREAPRLTIVGDAHLGNFGAFRGAAEGEPVFGINDHDQAGTGSPEWDLLRLAASIVIAARGAGGTDDDARAAAATAARAYAGRVRAIAGGRDAGETAVDRAGAAGPVKKLLEKAKGQSRGELLEEHAARERADGSWAFGATDEVVPLPAAREHAVRAALAAYEGTLGPTPRARRPLAVLAVAEKRGSGGSSYGLDRHVALLGRPEPAKKPLLLELKSFPPSSLPGPDGAPQEADAGAVVAAMRVLGAPQAANPLSGAARLGERSFLVREIDPEKRNLRVEKLDGPRDVSAVAETAARCLAAAHACAAGSRGAAIARWLGEGESEASGPGDAGLALAVAGLAALYADQVAADHAALAAAVRTSP